MGSTTPPPTPDAPLVVPPWKPLSVDAVDAVVDFGADERLRDTSIPLFQREGTAAIYNLLARNRVAYLGDEVGMGKTFVALAVIGLLRLVNPLARVVVIAPRENIQRKWILELENFAKRNWRRQDLRFRSLQDTPVREPLPCDSIPDFVELMHARPDVDAFLRTTSFSVWTSKADYQKAARKALRAVLPWLRDSMLPIGEPRDFRHAYARVLNAGVPEIDLLVVDEGHNLKHGFDPDGSTRNVLLAGAFGHPALAREADAPWYRPKVRRLLLLSATPFEHDYADLHRQIDLFGLGDLTLHDAAGVSPRGIRVLGDVAADAATRRGLVERLLVRRVSGIKVAGTLHTRNMYRREWRGGGLSTHDEPLATADVRQRLVVALVQKKVAEAIGDPKFGRHFQIGMLTSFESFLESSTGRRSDGEGDERGPAPTFYGDQTDDRLQQEGVDSHSIGKIVRGYRARFHEELPHPKVNATVDELERAFDTGEKVLVFVRRIASMDELKARLDARFNARLEQRLRDEFATEPGLVERPEVGATLEAIIKRYEEMRLESIQRRGFRSDQDDVAVTTVAPPGEVAEEVLDDGPDDDSGSVDTFFAWFFRGDGSKLPPDIGDKLSGSAFRTNRLGKPTSPYSLLFEDDVVAWVIGAASPMPRSRPSDVRSALIGHVAAVEGGEATEIERRLQTRACAWFHALRERASDKGFPALRAFEAWQAAGLEALARLPGPIGAVAGSALERFGDRFRCVPGEGTGAVDAGFPSSEVGIGVATVPTRLARHPELTEALLPEEWPPVEALLGPGAGDAARRALERRDTRRTLFSGQCRLGAPYIDLYVLAIATIGSLESGAKASAEGQVGDLARRFVDRLAAQATTPGFHAYAELLSTASLFDVVIEKNFDGMRGARHDQLPRTIQKTLASQGPVASSGKAGLTRSVRQFRMPGYPLVLITTDMLREGEDLHTFCRKVVHYGITWTPSGMEQRVGRIDRIGGLLQRQCSGRVQTLRPEEMIQIYYPFLADTVELLQINAVLYRMNEFVRLMHRNVSPAKVEVRTIDTARKYVEPLKDVSPILGPLVSAFGLDDRQEWLAGGLIPDDAPAPSIAALRKDFDDLWEATAAAMGPQFTDRKSEPFTHAGLVSGMGGGDRRQPVSVTLRGTPDCMSLVLRCESVVGSVRGDKMGNLVPEVAPRSEHGDLKFESVPGLARKERVLLVASVLPFGRSGPTPKHLAEVIRRVAVAADDAQRRLFDSDPERDRGQGAARG